MIHLVPLASDEIMCGADIPWGEGEVDSGYGIIYQRERTCPACIAVAEEMYGKQANA